MYTEPPPSDRGPIRNVLSRLTMPIDDWAREGTSRHPSYLMVLMGALLTDLVIAAAIAIAWGLQWLPAEQALVALMVALIVAVGLLLVVMYQVHHHLLRPLAQLYSWALSMCDGEFGTRIPADQRGRFAKLAYHINRLSEALDNLANEMDDTVWKQTEGLRVQNESLEVLFETASAINVADNLEELLTVCAHTLEKTTRAHAMLVRLREDDGSVRVVASNGTASGRPAPEPCGNEVEFATGLVIVPLRYQGRSYGDIVLYTRPTEVCEEPEQRKLLLNVGKHLGMAVAKSRLEEESRKLSLVRERTTLAHELHDSLAQTLAGLRFQVQVLGEKLRADDGASTQGEIERIQLSLDEANTELRELISNFRAPVDGDGMVTALEALVERARRHSTMSIFAQTEGPVESIAASAQIQLLRIAREALSNACKHSEARTARVLLRVTTDGRGHLLVEDDGRGLDTPAQERNPGEQIGLSIMDERARRLHGRLHIDSEAGEGTRVMVDFRLAPGSEDDASHANVS